MKKIVVGLLLIMTICLLACGTNKREIDNNLVGKWKDAVGGNRTLVLNDDGTGKYGNNDLVWKWKDAIIELEYNDNNDTEYNIVFEKKEIDGKMRLVSEVGDEIFIAEDSFEEECKQIRTELVATTPDLNLDKFWTDISLNKAKAEMDYSQKMFKVKVSVYNIDTDKFSYMYKDGGYTKTVTVYLPTEELAKLINGDKITVLGKLDSLYDSGVSINNAFVVDSRYTEQQTYDEATIKDVIENYNPIGSDGNIHWDIGSSPFFIDNRLTFEEIDSKTFLEVMDGEWIGKEYSHPKDKWSIIFTSKNTANVSKNNGEIYEWKYKFSGTSLMFPESNRQFYEVRKVADNLIVLYANTIDYVPYWIIYKEN